MIRKRLIFLLITTVMFFTFCKKEVKTIPDYLRKGTPENYIHTGYGFLSQGSLNIAGEHFKKALKKRPDSLKAMNGLGIVFLKQMKFEESLKQFKKILRYTPGNPDVYNFIGIIYSEQGKYELAKQSFLIAANSDHYRTPENAFLNLALIELKKEKPDSALRYIEKGLIKNPEFVQLYNLKGKIFEKKGFYKKAVYNYERALKLSQIKDIGIKINVARGYIKMGQRSKALNLLEKMIGEAPSVEIRTLILNMIKQVENK